jgi:hypothetical protein
VCTYADLIPRSMRTYRSAEADIAVALHGQWLPPECPRIIYTVLDTSEAA